ncbi:MAG: hypothetical protein QM493_07540 [Sulfurovum sp.]
MLISCGGGGGDNSSSGTDNTTFQLTMGNVTVDSSSVISGVTINVDKGTLDLAIISINLEGTITLGGNNSDKFKLTTTDGKQQLSFVDTNYLVDEIYEVDISAVSNDGQKITYEVKYKIISTDTADNRPLIFYFNAKSIKNNSKGTLTVEEGNNSLATLLLNKKGVIKISGGVDRDFFQLIGEDNNTKLSFSQTIETDSPLDENKNNIYIIEITATDGVGNSIVIAIEYEVINPNYTVKAESIDIIKSASYGPNITDFSLTGNQSNEDGVVILSSLLLNGKYGFSINWDSWIYSNYLYLFFQNTTQEIIQFISIVPDRFSKSLKDNCNYLGNYKYKCANLTIDDSIYYPDEIAPTLTTFNILICDKEYSDSTKKCSLVSLPIELQD